MNLRIVQYVDRTGQFVAAASFEGGFHVVRYDPFTGQPNGMELFITEEQLDLYYNEGHLVQQVFPDLTDGQREFLMTGSTPESWEKTFSPR